MKRPVPPPVPVPPAVGPTGQWPRGPLNSADEGELQLGITVDRGTVILAFGVEVSWVGLTPAIAKALGETLIAKAAEAAKVS